MTKFSSDAVDAWVGPFGGRYDFLARSLAVEVKSTTQRKGRVVTVHGHDQLEIPNEGELYLIFLRIEESDLAGEPISRLVKDLTELGCDRIKVLSKLANLGVTVDVIAKCEDFRFALQENRVYQVHQDFPRITTSSFLGERLPNGVISLSYQIDLTSEPPYPLPAEQIPSLYRRITNA
jgi:hypothetical protein